MNVCERIKSTFSLYDVAAMVGVELPQRAGVKFGSPFRPDRHPSCTVYRRGENWRFKDWSHGTDADQIEFYSLARGIDTTQAIRELAQKLDDAGGGNFAPNDKRLRPFPNKISPIEKPLPMPAVVVDAWNEGLSHLQGNARWQQRIAEWRGWTVELVAQLVDDGAMATPLYHGERYIAFRVDYPGIKDFGAFGAWFSTEQIGWHVRLKPKQAGDKASWRFDPSESEHGRGIPSLPFILGDFSTAQLLVITEGQWDAITFAHVAGWLSHDTAWPQSVCVLGIRGAQGVAPFFDHYAPHWLTKPKCLLLPDNDSAGTTWYHDARLGRLSFLQLLAERCGDVYVQTVPGAKDFGEAFQRGLVKREDIDHLFCANGFTT